MSINFFDFVNDKIGTLNKTEKKIFDYVVENIDAVKGMSIRKLSNECYVSTTTLFRFVKKLGFVGYNEFISTLRIGYVSDGKVVIPQVVKRQDYNEEYLKNIIEAIRVIKKDDAEKFVNILRNKPKIYIFGTGLTFQVVGYIHYLLLSMDYDATIINRDYEKQHIIRSVSPDDLVLIFSFSGENDEIIDILEQIKVKNNNIVSITRADNNLICSLSNINFYIFSDSITNNGNDLSSRISMIAIMETLLYKSLS
ncbi:MurR/RpiR family transcriptional regulator [Clostridium sardiniense]|uniref:MurR/RpiR family transcriptional regulator n=1 Tax=Clostridium sardiniense TaxID=29369 RepID=UPI003D325AFB